jgi:hypothetical protein
MLGNSIRNIIYDEEMLIHSGSHVRGLDKKLLPWLIV